jgi:hypothetical protein
MEHLDTTQLRYHSLITGYYPVEIPQPDSVFLCQFDNSDRFPALPAAITAELLTQMKPCYAGLLALLIEKVPTVKGMCRRYPHLLLRLMRSRLKEAVLQLPWPASWWGAQSWCLTLEGLGRRKVA